MAIPFLVIAGGIGAEAGAGVAALAAGICAEAEAGAGATSTSDPNKQQAEKTQRSLAIHPTKGHHSGIGRAI